LLLRLEERSEAFEIDEVREMLKPPVFDADDWGNVLK
jgi:hypothetical protein